LTAGCDEYLLKPVDFSLLDEVLTRHLPRIPVAVTRTSGELERGPTPGIAPL
jgi:DNA-binding response OmpR family regulator